MTANAAPVPFTREEVQLLTEAGLVFWAIEKEAISVSRGAEILGLTLTEFNAHYTEYLAARLAKIGQTVKDFMLDGFAPID
jgi:hypothetical protein